MIDDTTPAAPAAVVIPPTLPAPPQQVAGIPSALPHVLLHEGSAEKVEVVDAVGSCEHPRNDAPGPAAGFGESTLRCCSRKSWNRRIQPAASPAPGPLPTRDLDHRKWVWRCAILSEGGTGLDRLIDDDSNALFGASHGHVEAGSLSLRECGPLLYKPHYRTGRVDQDVFTSEPLHIAKGPEAQGLESLP
ncbi:hypothetical protein ACH47B_31295 [Rhodococcus sp. NPDC019627]|uniref:hypothetical protein n=1 Tax=unclassified Rhodococcus (in: high G+C Gram-positive bacteria) TaxID=192944 RepID=UPI0033F42915